MECATITAVLKQKVDEWLDFDKNEKTKEVIKKLHDGKNFEELGKLLLTRMEFGTAGLRARMGPGNSQMNDLTIIQTCQGLLKFCESSFPNLKELGLVVGYDGRHNSKCWARLTANIFLRAGCPVHLFPQVNPTPFVAYAVRHLGAACGVMITASHNPKDDNGFKVYWSNGAQIISPIDKGISQAIEQSLVPRAESWQDEFVDGHPLCHDPLPSVMETYMARQKEQLCLTYDANVASSLKLTYTAMHGVGWVYVQRILREFGFQHVVPVKEQVEPDPEFPTVRFPNPEEGKSALDLAIRTADEHQSPVILANDPDADRLALAERLAGSNKWKIFTGNEMGALFGWWLWTNFLKRNPQVDKSTLYMLSSAVSSKILSALSKREGFNFDETLTGFKWMGNLTEKLTKAGSRVLFAFEEAIGFMCGDIVLDKDGLSALVVMSELAVHTYGEGRTLVDQLQTIYEHYGYHAANNGYYFCYEPPVMLAMFDRLRQWGSSSPSYPPSCGPYPIVAVRDLTNGYDDAYPDKKARLPTSSSNQMITFNFANGCVVTIRGSGTEPKIKFYSEYCARPEDRRPRSEIDSELADLIRHVIAEFYRPEVNNLTARKD